MEFVRSLFFKSKIPLKIIPDMINNPPINASLLISSPKNIKAKHPNGSIGRGVQYPFIKPLPGEYHSNWDESRLDSWKEVVKQLIYYHSQNQQSPLRHISTEFIPATDYGEGNKYSLFENSVACAKWIKRLYSS